MRDPVAIARLEVRPDVVSHENIQSHQSTDGYRSRKRIPIRNPLNNLMRQPLFHFAIFANRRRGWALRRDGAAKFRTVCPHVQFSVPLTSGGITIYQLSSLGTSISFGGLDTRRSLVAARIGSQSIRLSVRVGGLTTFFSLES